jgi:hypothetical protein
MRPMYVNANGKWHLVERVIKPGAMKIYLCACGQTYPGECNTSEDKAVLDSQFFCGKCLSVRREKVPAS